MKLVFPRLYAIMDAALLPAGELAFARRLAESGVELIQYRDKQASSRRLYEACKSLMTLLPSGKARLIVNDRPDVAALVRAGGVHLGQEDLGVEEARAICGSGFWVGTSTHTLDQVREADLTSADYIAIGPIFATRTKQKADPVVGVEFVPQARRLTRKPLVAIGGITLERAGEVYRAGADSLAVASDLLSAADPARRAGEFLQLATRVFSEQAGGPS